MHFITKYSSCCSSEQTLCYSHTVVWESRHYFGSVYVGMGFWVKRCTPSLSTWSNHVAQCYLIMCEHTPVFLYRSIFHRVFISLYNIAQNFSIKAKHTHALTHFLLSCLPHLLFLFISHWMTCRQVHELSFKSLILSLSIYIYMHIYLYNHLCLFFLFSHRTIADRHFTRITHKRTHSRT